MLDLKTDDPRQDQRKIAELYVHEAARLRQMARDQFHRAALYERLFGRIQIGSEERLVGPVV